MTLVDTAGLREAPGLVERLGVERTMEEIKRADLIIHVIDGQQPLIDPLDVETSVSILTVASKLDLLEGPPTHASLAFSSMTGEGLDTLKDRCRTELGGHFEDGSGLVLTRKRQLVAVQRLSLIHI